MMTINNPMPAANSATPNETTDVNSDVRRNDAVITVSRGGIVLRQLCVGLAVAGLQGVLLDRLRFAVRGQRTVDLFTGEVVGIVGDDDLLVGELVADEEPGDGAGDEQDHARHHDDDAQHANRLRRRRLVSSVVTGSVVTGSVATGAATTGVAAGGGGAEVVSTTVGSTGSPGGGAANGVSSEVMGTPSIEGNDSDGSSVREGRPRGARACWPLAPVLEIVSSG